VTREEPVVAGVDLGSTYTKAAVLARDRITGTGITPTVVDLDAAAEGALVQALAAGGVDRAALDMVVTTGYGRRAIGMSHNEIDEIYAKAVAAKWLGSPWGPVRTVIDIGGQDSKVLRLDEEGSLDTFLMNTKCAAGTGRFLEAMARVLGVTLDELGPLGMRSRSPVELSNTCIVMAESEVVSLIAQRRAVEDIVAGIHVSVAERVGNMAKQLGVVEVVFFDGGPARNAGLKAALERVLDVELYVPKNPQVSAAIGAALVARDAVRSGLMPDGRAVGGREVASPMDELEGPAAAAAAGVPRGKGGGPR
jgi:predicted CoA-substrate-specific enzyme activase